tara:strand:+ start:1894 stop:2955 length:1062 start_codon:yes stop_codon:yes gene_type:complete
MKKIAICLSFLYFSFLNAVEINLEKVIDNLEKPWGMSFINQNDIILTEKAGKLYFLNIEDKNVSEIKHNLSVLETGQGGLLDVLYHENYIYVSYTENRGQRKTSTSVAKGKFNKTRIDFKNIFRAEPPIESGYHFGSRLVIKDQHIYISAGERGKGMIAQDTQKHPGSIIRVNLDGTIPKDNPKFNNKKDWLPEIFQIGVRNPQGMSLSPFDKKIYMTNHGARGGDWFGEVKKGENYGWKILGWGGTNYSGTKIGPKWKAGFTRPIKYWVPSIAVSALVIYQGKSFEEWNGNALVGSLKDQSLRKIEFKNGIVINEKIIFKGDIGRIRDIKIQKKTGELFMLSDRGEIWRMFK